MTKLSRRNVKVWPIRLPPSIESEDDKELMLTLTSLRSAQRRRLVFHSMDSSVVKFVMKAVSQKYRDSFLFQNATRTLYTVVYFLSVNETMGIIKVTEIIRSFSL